MSVLRHVVTAGGSLALALMAVPLSLPAQVVAPGTNPRPTTTNPAPTTTPSTSSSPTSSQPGDPEVRHDLPFLQEATSANLLEVRLGQLAQTNASSAAVKQFGQRMVGDHTNLEEQMTGLVSRNRVELSPALTSAEYQKINRLQALSGPQFDQAYMTLMIQDHQKDVATFENQSKNADSPQVRDLAARSVPVLQQHLSLAQQVGSQVNVQVATVPGRSKVYSSGGQARAQAEARNADVRADNDFIHEVGADNLLEVRLSDLAERKAKSSAVKQFARRIASEHTRLQNDWVNMASVNGQDFKPGIGKNHRDKLDRLGKLSGRAFDRAYMSMEIMNHKDYIDYFEREGRGAHSRQVREMVSRELPILRTDFAQAKRVGAEVGADTNVSLRSETK